MLSVEYWENEENVRVNWLKFAQYSILASELSGSTFIWRQTVLLSMLVIREKNYRPSGRNWPQPEDLDILVTHEHKDHIMVWGFWRVKVQSRHLCQRSNLASDGKDLGKLDASRNLIFEMGKMKTFGDLDIS